MTENPQHTLTLPWVKAATAHYVNADDMQRAFSLAIAAGLNLIFSGPGGHGKSEFLMDAIGAIENMNPFVKSFGQGTSPEELYGGIDMEALNRQGGAEKAAIQYNPEFSFLAHLIAVFEELFDAPSRVLTSLKDTMTARALRNGHQYFEMMTRVIFAATNHSPQEIAEGGPEIAALIERFPIQLEVKWPEYGEESFVELFTSVTGSKSVFDQITWDDVSKLQERARNVTLSPVMQRILARIIVELRRDNVVISPRTAVLSMQLVRAAAAINGRDRAIAQDIKAIAFLPGAHSLRSRISELIEEYSLSMVNEEELERLQMDFEEARGITATTEYDLKELTQYLDRITNKVLNLKLDTSLAGRRQNLLQEVRSVRAVAQKALDEFALMRNFEEHERTLDNLEPMVTRLAKEYYNSRDRKRDEARMALRRTKDVLNAMQVHEDLKERHTNLLMKIHLTGAA